MEFRNGILLQLFECIESTQNEVKRKMIETGACNAVPKSHARLAREEKVRVTSQLTVNCSPATLRLPRARFRFKSQIVPVEIPAKNKGQPPVIFDKDEGPHEDTTIEVLRALKPAFKKDGTVTAGNAPGVNDGAAAMVRIVAQATSGVEPKWVMMAPVGAVQRIWEKTGDNSGF